MNKPRHIKAAYERKHIRSYNALAAVLMKVHPDVFVVEGRSLNSTSLGTKIGELDRGDPTWWLNRADAVRALVAYLELDVNDLDLKKKTGRYVFAPDVFPDFPPLSLVRENSWQIAEPKKLRNNVPIEVDRYSRKPTLDYWLTPGAIGIGPSAAQWLQVPDQIEFDLLSRELAAVSRHRVIFGQTIDEILDKHLDNVHHESALVLVIQRDQVAEQLELLMQHRQGAPLLVISPWPQPPLPEAMPGVRGTKTIPLKRLECESWVWTLLPEWRKLLLRWIGERFAQADTGSGYSSDAALQLLDKFDPGRQWFTGVEDVLVLAQAVTDLRENDHSWSAGSASDVAALLDVLFYRDKANLSLIQRLVEARWTSWQLQWAGALDQDDWSALAKDVCRFDVLLEQFVTPYAEGHDFKRPIVIRLLLRSYLIRQLNGNRVDAWMPACFDAQRRPLLDAALDALSVMELEGVAFSLSNRLDSPACLGAGEALFAAVGRRMVRGEPLGNTLPRLLAPVMQRLRSHKDVLVPYSRPLDSPAALVEWVSICWAWSFRSEAYASVPASWQFPAWHQELPARVPDWLNAFGASHASFSWERLTLPLLDFAGVVRRWLSMLESVPHHDMMPPVFFTALLMQAAQEGGWPAEPDWWTAVIGNVWAEQALLTMVAQEQGSVHRAALAWWPSLVASRHRKAAENNFFPKLGTELFTPHPGEQHHSPLLAWVMAQLESDADGAVNALDEADRIFLMRHPDLLSPAFRRALLKAVPGTRLDLFSFEIPGFLFAYGSETRDEMEALLDLEQWGGPAARCLWIWAPRETTQLLGCRNLTATALRNLLAYSPASALAGTLAVLRERTDLLAPDERAAWARERLYDARQHAAELLGHALVMQACDNAG